MKRRLTVLLCLVLSLLLLTGCASQTISKAKTAYANGDYQAVVDLLEGMKNPKPEIIRRSWIWPVMRRSRMKPSLRW